MPQYNNTSQIVLIVENIMDFGLEPMIKIQKKHFSGILVMVSMK